MDGWISTDGLLALSGALYVMMRHYLIVTRTPLFVTMHHQCILGATHAMHTTSLNIWEKFPNNPVFSSSSGGSIVAEFCLDFLLYPLTMYVLEMLSHLESSS